jgi:nucleotide-binding universal stress UspA family protein
MGFSGNITLDPLVLNSVDTLKQASLDFLDKSRHHLADETIQMIVEEGGYSETILKTAKKLHADIIVMGSHSQKWLENILVGSVTEEVLHHTTIPLFIVPTKKHH